MLLEMTGPDSHSDLDLLRQYATDGSQAAFTALVQRHVNLVYSAALRQIRSPQLAEDITQSVFHDLARNAAKLTAPGGSPVITAWLYQVARRTAIDVIRQESRRQLREQIAMELNTMNATAAEWPHIEPLLDDAMAALSETDRTAILLRYFENKSLAEVGLALGTSDDTAQKRVSRAVDQLRDFFDQHKVTVGASGLAVLISANAVQAAPVGLVATIATTTLAGTAVTATTAIATKTIAMTTLQKILVTASVTLLAGASIFEAHEASQLRGQNLALQQQQATLQKQIDDLQHAPAVVAARPAMTDADAVAAKNAQAELLRLRGEVTRLRLAATDSAGSPSDSRTDVVKSWLAREARLRQSAEQNPDKSIPEFKLLSEQQWLNAAMDARFDTEADLKRTLANLRHTAENNFASDVHAALEKYMQTNNGAFPTAVSDLQPYFSSPMDEAILNRWVVASKSANPNVGVGDMVITDKDPVDSELDQHWAVGKYGYGSSNYQSTDESKAINTLKPAMQAYAADHNGAEPADPAQFTPYLITPEQKAAYQLLLKKHAASSR